jgi:exosortase sorting signal-containing protein
MTAYFRAPLHCIALGLFAWIMAGAANAEQVRVIRLSPATQSVLPGEVVPVPFRLRVERASGEPVAGAQFGYRITLYCQGPGDDPTCDQTPFGGFEPSDPGDPLLALLTTGSDGTATTPPYRVGRPASLPLELEFEPIFLTHTTPGGIVIDGMLDGDHNSIVTIEGLLAIPTLGSAGMATLVGLLAAAGVWTVGRTRS